MSKRDVPVPHRRDTMASGGGSGPFERRWYPVQLEHIGSGVWRAPGARIIDRAGERRLPIGDDGFARAIRSSVLVDKTMLIADVLDSGYTCTLFCRPRRFGKTLNMTMLKAFFEASPEGDACGCPARDLFEGTEVWDAAGGRYRAHCGAYPVIHVSFNTVKSPDWPTALGAIRNLVVLEYQRHGYLASSAALSEDERAYFRRVSSGAPTEDELADSLQRLSILLRKHHGQGVVLLVDEYDAPVMTGYTNGYYQEVTSFLKRWLTGALKDGGAALAFACLTGVQRISKESVFSDLNNLMVSTPLSADFDERYGFTEAEVEALATYLGQDTCMDEARRWYDGYRFGSVDAYNPWSVLNYLNRGCVPGVYWVNTSSNDVVGQAVACANEATLSEVYDLLEPGGLVLASLDLGVVFPDVGVRENALWSMLYLAGYLTTDVTESPDDDRARRPLRIPNQEIRHLFRREVIERFTRSAGGERRLGELHRGLCRGDSRLVEEELARIARDSASSFDLVSENACHLLVLGLCFGIAGYGDPRSNREAGHGRFDIQIEPVSVRPGSLDAVGALAERPRITIELKHQAGADEARLGALAQEALDQIARLGYDEAPLPDAASGRMRWGVAFSGKRVAARCECVG